MLINLSNHPSEKWEAAQLETASQYGEIINIPFPNIPPEWNTKQVEKEAKEYFNRIKKIESTEKEKLVIHLAGEPTFCFQLSRLLLTKGFRVVTSTTERIVQESENEKKSIFKFKQFREYKMEKKVRFANCKTINWYKNQNPEDKTRLKSLAWLILAEVTVLFLINLFFFTDLRVVLSELVCRGLCCFPFLFKTYQSIVITSIVLFFFFIISIIFLFRIRKKAKNNSFGFSMNSKTAAKLFANAIQPRVINVLYLIIFIVHLGCIGNIVYSLFTGEYFSEIRLNIYFFIVIFLGTYYLIYTFPRPEKKEKNGKKIFFSGMPTLNLRPNAGLIDNLNLIPFVSQFFVIQNSDKNIKLNRGDKIFVLHTKEHNLNYFKKLFETDIPYLMGDGNCNQAALDKYNKEIANIRTEFNMNPTVDEINNIIRKIVKMVTKYVFSENKDICEIVDQIEIIFTTTTDYNNFNDCYMKAQQVIEEEEKKGYEIILNCSPGTVAVSACLTILSMQRNRRLLYYSQDKQITPKYRMQEIMENKLDFKELIEKISEELSDTNN